MMDLHMIELLPDLRALFQFLEVQGLLRQGIQDDPAYGIHAWLNAAFGELAPKPFRLLLKRGRPTRLLGYARVEAERLAERMSQFADPSVIKVCQPVQIASRPMPERWPSGRILGFQVLCCPVVRHGRVEKDAFLARADVEGKKAGLRRGEVYGQWLRRYFGEAAEVSNVRLVGFRLQRLIRRTCGRNGDRRVKTLIRPSAFLTGDLMVCDGQRFSNLLARGIGRHRALGFGMLLLRPA